MIEHFKKFDEGDNSLLPLSFSHLNEFAFYRERWALRRIFGYQFPTSASAERGSAVESGLNMREYLLSDIQTFILRIKTQKRIFI